METTTFFEILGTSGSIIICASGIPQIIKTYQTKSAGDFSMMYLAILLLGMTMLEFYSLYSGDFVFIFGNSLSMLITCILLFFCFKYSKREVKGMPISLSE
ncbi:MAG: SemiSWEET family transporter [Desulfobulbaceae bacterium]|nr:SemiSWEET family transporter [Desulfobulbaceae bacterium]